MYRLSTLAREAGFRGLFAGLGPRCLMTAGLVAGQFAIYGAIKDGESSFALHICIGDISIDICMVVVVAMGAPPGLEIHK